MKMDSMQKILYDTYSSAIEQIPEMIERNYSLQIMDDIFDDGKINAVGTYLAKEGFEIDDIKIYLYDHIRIHIHDLSILNMKILCRIIWIFNPILMMNDYILNLFRDDTIVYIQIFFGNEMIAEYGTSNILKPYIISDQIGKSICIHKRYDTNFPKMDELHIIRTIESLSFGG